MWLATPPTDIQNSFFFAVASRFQETIENDPSGFRMVTNSAVDNWETWEAPGYSPGNWRKVIFLAVNQYSETLISCSVEIKI